jgi:hypothetical protein
MAKKATKLEDIGDERDQKVFAAVAKVWFGGDDQAMLDWYNEKGEELENMERQSGVVTSAKTNFSEAHLRFKHQ